MIDKISLHNLLPRVFDGMQGEAAIERSQIWLRPEVSFERGCRISIEAESGSGKSSLLSFIYGNRRDYLGSILFDGCRIRDLSTEQWCDRRCRSLALLPQELRLFGELSVMDNIRLKNNLTGYKTEAGIMSMLDRLGIADKASSLACHLSIGQQQRVAVVRAVCQPFDFLMLDEPVSHLDERRNRDVADMVAEEADRLGAGIITTSVGHSLLLKDAKTICL